MTKCSFGAATEDSSGTWAALGYLRFFLAIIVFTAHLGGFVIPLPSGFRFLADFNPFAAVASFLLVSGYSIAASLERGGSVREFYQRRVDRIAPVYLLAIALGLVPFALYGNSLTGGATAPASLWQIFGNLLPLGGLLVPTLATVGVMWSLSIECVYYAAAPLLFRLPSRTLWGLVGVSAALFLLHDAAGVPLFPVGVSGRYGVFALLSCWLSGLLIRRDARAGTPALLLCVALVCRYQPMTLFPMGGFTAAVTVSLLAAARGIRLAPALSRWGERLGDWSYPLYCLHLPVLFLLGGSGQVRPWWLYSACTLAVAAAAHHLIEVPLKKRQIRSRQRKIRRVSSTLDYLKRIEYQ